MVSQLFNRFRPLLMAIAMGGLLSPQVVHSRPANVNNLFQSAALKPRFSPDPMELRGISGGSTPAQQVAGRAESQTGACLGFTDEKPDHTLQLAAFFNYLNLQIQSPEDTTLVIKGPGGVWCNDDFQGKNPGIAGEWLPGTYEVWVGSYKKEKYIPYILRLTEVR